jgi:hypothetical protein
MNPFSENYKSLKNSDLLNIIRNPQDYQPLAVEAANNELTNRQLSNEELAEAEFEFELVQKERENKIEKQREIESKLMNVGTTLAETLNPVQKSELTSDNAIRLLTIVFGGMSIYRLYAAYRDIKNISDIAYFDWIGGLFSLVLLFLVPIATFQFWKRKKNGWILFSILFTFGCLSAIKIAIFAIHLQLSNIPGIERFIGPMNPVVYAMTFAFYAAALWMICKPNIREIYNIERDEMFRRIGISTGVIVLILLITFFIN